MPDIVEQAVRASGRSATVMPAKGIGIRAADKPFSEYRRKTGGSNGFHWRIPSTHGTRELRAVHTDTNYWKSFVHARLAAPAGDRGAMTLFGTPKIDHGLFAQHIAGSETWTPTEGHGRAVREWKPRPLRPDNHWLDCLVGCAVGASILGVKTPEQEADGGRRPRKKVSISSARGRRTA